MRPQWRADVCVYLVGRVCVCVPGWLCVYAWLVVFVVFVVFVA